ncbi:MAG: TetR/AcrR family transcriptional regulator [Roseburia sp.]|nr:TetR/AcrR family transcriptional regulator [Roseburia sp.]MCM1097010.1 TetR/AcrR family transcriptional regulator [Ruminococcus flavefaciens]
MPKIIEDVRRTLLAEARRQLAEKGYARATIRSVAGACGLAVGTVYNYFPSKDMLIASFMAEDWMKSLSRIDGCATQDSKALLRGIYRELREFSEQYSALFADEEAVKAFSAVFTKRHKMLRDQLAGRILPVCRGENREFLAEFAAEALLIWTTAGKSFEEIYAVLERILA